MKSKSVFVCQQCGSRSAKWLGKCNSCGAWGSYAEEIEHPSSGKPKLKKMGGSSPIRLSEITQDENSRIETGIKEFDRVLGGGIIAGSLILVGGDPGIGKSTLMLQMCGNLQQFAPLYVTGEESLQQVKFRSERLGINPELMLLSETNIEQINAVITSTDCDVIVVDSIQSVASDRIDSTPGSILQVRECAALLMQTAKQTGKAIFIIGHVTKEGIIAGPKILEHLVDTVLQFEGEKTYSYRILRSLKNRFGSTNEIGIFDMSSDGLRQVSNPSELFLVHREHQDSGVAIVAAIEGTRPILLEIQALVSTSGYNMPQRTSTGFEMRRLQMILAVLEKRLGIQFRQQDVFVNVAGGVYMNDPSLDLAVAAALVSSHRDSPIDGKTVLIGEIGLTGEVRPVPNVEQRIIESEKLGFKRILVPKPNAEKLSRNFDMEIIPVERISLALSQLMK
ncbi:MAG: replication and repair protein RadA [Ignavibacteria bacterium]|nr:replication and repair protein RadA [Ignavibacteria bacterium]